MKMSLIARLKLRFAPEKEIDDIKSILSKRPIKDKGIFNRLWKASANQYIPAMFLKVP